MDTSECAIPCSPERKLDPNRGFDSRIPISLSNPKQSNNAEGNNRLQDGLDKDMNNEHQLPITRRGSAVDRINDKDGGLSPKSDKDPTTSTTIHHPSDVPNSLESFSLGFPPYHNLASTTRRQLPMAGFTDALRGDGLARFIEL
jgi:hypothetical protein